jgi:ribulose-5-phosphate 4-epimerase/fuculose-1-phosphate aldolase
VESIARMAYITLGINAAAEPIGSVLHDKHYRRKHGENAHYGQGKPKPKN